MVYYSDINGRPIKDAKLREEVEQMKSQMVNEETIREIVDNALTESNLPTSTSLDEVTTEIIESMNAKFDALDIAITNIMTKLNTINDAIDKLVGVDVDGDAPSTDEGGTQNPPTGDDGEGEVNANTSD